MATHLTEEEAQNVRDGLAARRRPGTYEPGKWSLSPYNRDSDALGGIPLPPSAQLRDITMRTIEQTVGVSVTHAERLRLGAGILEAGVSAVEVPFHRFKQDDYRDIREEIQYLRDRKPDVDVKLGGIETQAQIDSAAEVGATLIDIWLPACPEITPIYWHEPLRLAWEGKDWRELDVPNSLEEQVTKASALIQYAKERGLAVSAGINMLPYASAEDLASYAQAMMLAGADQITLFDGPSGLGPEAWAYLVGVAKRAAPQCEIGVHTHNMFGLAVANALSSVRAGASVVEVSVNGMCAASGQADVAQVAVSLEALYGISTGLNLEQLTPLARLGSDLSRIPIERNRPIVGDEVFNWGGTEIVVQELKIEPLLHWCLEPAIVGNKKKWIVDRTSGPWTMLDKLVELGITVDRSSVPLILQQVKDEMLIRRRPLTDDEISSIAQPFRVQQEA